MKPGTRNPEPATHNPQPITAINPVWMPDAMRRRLLSGGHIERTFSFSRAERKIYRKRKKIPVSAWAEKHRIVTMSALPGPWRNEVTPYLSGIMDASFYPSVQTVILCAAPQTGKSESVHNCIGYAIDREPGPVLYVYPDEKTANENSRDRIQPMITASPRLASYMTGVVNDATKQQINLEHMPIYLAWARSAASLANKPIRHLVFDEIDKYPDTAGKREADPLSLGEKRTRTYRWSKNVWKISTPTIEAGNIWQALTVEAQVRFVFHPQCPDCGMHHLMAFTQIKWPEDERDPERVEANNLAWYECPECGAVWDDDKRNKAVCSGRWVCRKTGLELFEYLEKFRPKKIGFHLPAWLSYFVSLSECAGAFLKGLKSKTKLKDFQNNYAAEPWTEVTVKTSEEKILKAGCDLPPMTVPAEAIALSCGIDVQKYGFWFIVRAWARDFTNWLVHYGQLSAWEDVEYLLFDTAYPVMDSDLRMRIWRCAMDTGGGKKFENMTMTEEIYWWIRTNSIGRSCRIYATKGSSRPLIGKVHTNKPLDRTPSGKPLPGGLQLYTLDTEKLKDMVIYRLSQAVDHGPHASYLHSGAGADYASQIMAEEKRRDHKGYEAWVQIRADNHLFDCECLAQVVVDPEWPGGGLNLVRRSGAEPGGRRQRNGRKVISKGI